jgi:hypothetical protein
MAAKLIEIKEIISTKWTSLGGKKQRAVIGAAVIISAGFAAWIGFKYVKYQEAYTAYSSALGKYKAEKLFYDSTAQACQSAEQAQNAGMDAMNEIVYQAMRGGATDDLQKRQAELGMNVSKAQSFIRDNCIGYEYNAPTPPVMPSFW